VRSGFREPTSIPVDFEHAFAGPPLEPTLDDQVAPVAILVGIFADDHAIFLEVQHLDPRDAGVACQNRRRAQRLFGAVNPQLIRVCVEDVLDLAFILVLRRREFLGKSSFRPYPKVDLLRIDIRQIWIIHATWTFLVPSRRGTRCS
jgi:hypothetical protein